MYFTLFILLPYMCIALCLFGLLQKLIMIYKKYIHKNNSQNSKLYTYNHKSNSIKYIVYLILLHFLGYVLIKCTFILFGISGNNLNNITTLIQGIVIAIFLTILTYKVVYNRIKNSIKITGNIYNNLLLILVVIHIFVGYIGIMFINDELDKKATSTMLSHYYDSLLSLDMNSYTYLLNLNFITLIHLVLGFLFLALVPYTKLMEDIFMMPVSIYNLTLRKKI